MIRLLFLASAPSTGVRLRLEQDVREIAHRLRASPHRDQIQLVSELTTRHADLQQVLLRTRPHVVHFSGHGAGDAILLEDERGQPVRFGEQALADLLRKIGQDVRLVVLNGCYSSTQAKTLAGSVDAVLWVPDSIDEAFGRAYMGAFYQAIAFDQSVRMAFDLARDILPLDELSLTSVPVLIARAGIDPETITFVAEGVAPSSARIVLPLKPLDGDTAGYDAQQFFQDAGFGLGAAEERGSFLCFPRADRWPEVVKGGAYARVFAERPLEGSDVIEIRGAAARALPAARVAFIVVARPVDDTTWIQIAAIRATGFNVVPVPRVLILDALTRGGRDPAEAILSKHLERFLGQRADPYNVRHPVFDVLNFFGREALSDELVHVLSNGQPVGLFGLRKMGKSSLLGYLRGRLAYPVASLDLQTGTALGDLYERVLRAWDDDARARLEIDLDISEIRIGAAEPTRDFVDITKDTLTKLALKLQMAGERRLGQVVGARLGILVDEIELLVPPAGASGEALDRYLSFTRALRGLIQEDPRLSIIVAGVDPAINRVSRCGAAGDQNPLFSFLQEIYIPPLLEGDCVQMVRNIGRQVAISYGDDAALRIATESGGHPYLARQLASLAYSRRQRRQGEVTLGEVEAAAEAFLYDVRYAASLNETGLWGELTGGPLWSEKVARVNEHLLCALARAPGPMTEKALAGEGEAARRRAALAALEQLSVIQRQGDGYALSFGLFRGWIRRVLLGIEGEG